MSFNDQVVPFSVDEDVRATSHVNFLSGAFQVEGWRIPYFVSTMSFVEAANDLRLINEMPGADRVRWTVSELFQRDIDWARVQGPLLQYLMQSNQPQFFNAITIALLPHLRDSTRLEDSFDEVIAWQPPSLADQERYRRVLDVGPIRFGFYTEWDEVTDPGFLMGRMRWNLDQVQGVAIDGQHRLAAIKEYVHRRQPQGRSRVPVIFLLLDPRVGFEGPPEVGLTSMLRTLFIDLNKHAKTVSRARQILLDDRDPISRCVRAFIANELAPDISSLDWDCPRMPLSLIDWHTEQAKFNEGPYVATVLGLDWMVGRLLGFKPVADMANYESVEAQVRSLAYRLDLDLSAALERLREDDDRLLPFSYSEGELIQIGDGFTSKWNRPLVQLLTRFAPYRDFIEMRRADGSLLLEWQTWFRLVEAAKNDNEHSVDELRAYVRTLQLETPAIPHRVLSAAMDGLQAFKRDNLAFNVVFQKAYIDAFVDFCGLTDADLASMEMWAQADQFDVADLDDIEEVSLAVDPESWQLSDEGEEGSTEFAANRAEERRAEQFVNALNVVLDVFPELLEVSATVQTSRNGTASFWDGSLRKADDGSIDYALGAAVRAKDIVYLGAVMALLVDACSGVDVTFDQVWSELTEDSEWPIFKKLHWPAYRLYKDERSIGGRIVRARGDEFERPEAMKAVEIRISAIWNRLAT